MTVLTSKQIAEYVAGTLSLGADHAYIARRFANEVLELRAENERLQRERDFFAELVEALSEHAKCGCGYDDSKDVCVYHQKMMAEARAKALEEAAAVADEQLGKDSFVGLAILALREKPTVQE